MSQGNASLSEPRSIVHSLTGKFHAAADVAAIQRIDEAFEHVQTARAQKLAVSRDTLHQWMKKVEAAKWEAQRPADRSEAAHAERMAQLDRDRYTLAKAVNDLELTIQREEATQKQVSERITTAERRLAQLEAGNTALDENRIRSLVFKDMGVSWALEELTGLEQVGKWRDATIKCRILSRRSNDVFTLTFGPNSNPFEDAHQMWNCLGK